MTEAGERRPGAGADGAVDATRVWRELRGLVMDGMEGYRRQVVEVSGLPFSRIRAVRRLHRLGPVTHAVFADALMTDRPAVTGVVDDLCERGLAVRTAHPSDRRCKLVSLTPEGERLVGLIESVVPAPPPGWDSLTPGELSTLAGLLDRITPTQPG